jgi:hypothetical protein
MADRVSRQGKENHAIPSDTCVDHYILLLKLQVFSFNVAN